MNTKMTSIERRKTEWDCRLGCMDVWDRETERNLASVISLTRHLSLSVVLLVPQPDGGTKPSFRDKPRSSLVFVRCIARPTDRRTAGNIAFVISVARHLSLSVVLLAPQTEM